MDKTAIKKYAIWARRELIERVSQRALKYGITAKDTGDPKVESINGHLLSQKEKWQREALISNIKEKGYEQVMEEVAYTWFNRFAALRFMEVNGYLPSHIRVFTNDAGEFKPQILAEAIHLELDGLDRKKVYELESANKSEELFKYLLIVQCNALNSILPGMFQKIDDYTELLLPDYLLREGSVIEQMVTAIPEEDWTDQVQIIGWMYEAYNTELNSVVYDGTLSKAKIPKELVPAATTIYTPDWPVQYMVQNSLGRLWMEGHPNEEMKKSWKYYLEEAEQEPEAQKQLAEIRKEYAKLNPEDIKVIDPCMGSGHILVVLFNVLLQIYESCGYSAREAVSLIVKKNLYGLDIDERAAQLAYFAIMMKARKHDRRFFTRGIQPRVYAIRESNNLDRTMIDYYVNRDSKLKTIMETLTRELYDAKEYGSILNVSMVDFPALYARFEEIRRDNNILSQFALTDLLPFVQVAETMAQQYDVIVTNPPYLGSSRFSSKLDHYVKEHYPEVKSDLSMVMFSHSLFGFSKKNGLVSFITTTSWMFLSSFEKLRDRIFASASITSLVDYGTELFDGKVGHNPIVSWVTRKSRVDETMTAVRLVDFCYSRRDEKEPEFFNNKNRHFADQKSFVKISGAPVAYWVSDTLLADFSKGKPIGDLFKTITGSSTGDNGQFLRLWFEVFSGKVAFNIDSSYTGNGYKWIFCNKGGPFRRWYGNNEYLINWENDGNELKAFCALKNNGKHWSRFLKSLDMFYRSGITWSKVTSGEFSARYMPEGFIMESAACAIMPKENDIKALLALMNTRIASAVLKAKNPTINMQTGDIVAIPIIDIKDRRPFVESLVDSCILISRTDWDSFEISWDFKKHPLVPLAYDKKEQERSQWGKHRMESFGKVQWHFEKWQKEAEDRFNQLKANEEELNRIFIDIYGLQDELTPEVDDKDVTVRKTDLQRDIRSLISYAVGCMFGRYSLDAPGLILAGQAFQEKFVYASVPVSGTGFCGAPSLGAVRGDCYLRRDKDDLVRCAFAPDGDNIIPICDDEYFEDDIVSRFVKFIEAVYGADSLEDNLKFIADALGGKGTPRQVIRSYFLNDFYTDHLKVYQKRPIYWLFDSGKKNGFKCLIYMHRYQPDTIARIRTDYVHEQQSRYRTAIADLEQRINGASTSERVKLNKQLTKLQDQATELRTYEEKIHHLADQMIPIDLDDGVKVNYAKFADVLAKIK